MNIRLIAPALLLVTLLRLNAQLSVEVLLDQDKYLPGETFEVSVRMVNTSGQTLQFGETSDWLKFSIETTDGRPVQPRGEPPVKTPFTLESTKRATFQVDLAPHFDLRPTGRYRISAAVAVPAWGKELTAKPVPFEVVQGTRLWEQEFGVPSTEPGLPPELRRYALQQANYLRNQLRLYVRVSGADGTVIKLINAGPMISFSNPEPRLDKQSRLHLLYQSGAKTFEYLVVSPDGVIEAFESIDHPFLIGVQWHPELGALGDDRQRRLFEALLPRPGAGR